MPIQYQLIGGTWGPVIVCDVCGKRIERYGEANALTRQLTQHTEDEHPIFVHWQCDDVVCEEYPNHEPLVVFLRNLILNGEVDETEAERLRKIYAWEA